MLRVVPMVEVLEQQMEVAEGELPGPAYRATGVGCLKAPSTVSWTQEGVVVSCQSEVEVPSSMPTNLVWARRLSSCVDWQ